MNSNDIQIEDSWKLLLKDEFQQPYMDVLRAFLKERIHHGATIFPPKEHWFEAFNQTPVESIKVVILGQDPYHGAGQAHGLSFSVPEGTPMPPSLRNIFKELHNDIGLTPLSTDLTPWAQQGVLLLNATLTVEEGQAGSHQKQGWEHFTDQVIARISDHCESVVFILWGKYAQNKATLIDENKHCILTAPHPSPLSAHRGFFGSKPFSQTNHYLESKNRTTINWQL